MCAQSQELPEVYVEYGLGPRAEGKPMEFRLTYRGELPSYSIASALDKHEIRQQFHPQLRNLWADHPNLKSYATRCGMTAASPSDETHFVAGIRELARNQSKYGFNFLPLVDKDHNLSCSLDVLFLRKGGPGNLVKNGDIDARIRTLFDALQSPQQLSELGGAVPREDEDPFYTLLENDVLVNEIKVTSDRLLDYPKFLKNSEVLLVIGVKLYPSTPVNTNWIFQ